MKTLFDMTMMGMMGIGMRGRSTGMMRLRGRGDPTPPDYRSLGLHGHGLNVDHVIIKSLPLILDLVAIIIKGVSIGDTIQGHLLILVRLEGVRGLGLSLGMLCLRFLCRRFPFCRFRLQLLCYLRFRSKL